MAEEHTLTTALQARQPSVSTNPIGLSANLTQQAEPAPQIDFVSKISDQLDALSGGTRCFRADKRATKYRIARAQQRDGDAGS
jgi:hypothetical protein